MGLLFEPGDESARPLQGHLVVVDAEEQEEPVARCPVVRTHQGRMVVRGPLVEAEQDGSIRIQDLTKVVMSRSRLRLAEERLIPFEAARNVANADDRPGAFHCIYAVGLTRIEQIGLCEMGDIALEGRRSWEEHEAQIDKPQPGL